MKRSRLGRLALMLAIGIVALTTAAERGDAVRGPGQFSVLASRQHGPVKIHQRRFDGEWDSYNWSGYAVTGASASVSDAKGSWVVPSVTCTASFGPKKAQTQYSSFWVGIDGWSSNSVEQIGTDSDCQNGKPVYYAWFEFYPNPSYFVNNFAVHPNDSISAEVTANGGGFFTVTLTNSSTGTNFSISSHVNNAQQSSAEWIAEAPSGQGGILPLANFQTADFGQNWTYVNGTGAATVSGQTGSIGSFGANVQSVTMVSERRPYPIKAEPSSLSTPDGTSFTDAWFSAGP